MTELMETALRYARGGTPVFPCGKDKRPLTAHGFKDATTDEAKIRQWWTKNPDAGIGMPTGKVSGRMVVDLDTKNGFDGRESLEDLETEHGKLPETLEVATPSNGAHLYFRMPDAEIGCSANKVAPAVDIRADGGYVLLAGSKNYIVDQQADIAELPPAWVEALATKPKPKPAKRGRPAVGPQSRDTIIRDAVDLISAAGSDGWHEPMRDGVAKLVSVGVPDAEIRAICSFKADAGFDDDDVATLIEGARTRFNKPGDDRRGPDDIFRGMVPPTFPLPALPKVLRDFVQTESAVSGFDTAGFAMGALTVAATAIPDSIKVVLSDNWQESTRWWTFFVDDSGGGKSPIIKSVTAPFKKRQKALLETYQLERRDWEKSTEKPKSPPPDLPQQYIINNASMEAAMQVLGRSGKQLLVQDELVGWITGMDRYTNKGGGHERAWWLECYNGTEDYAINRKDKIETCDASVSVMGGIQVRKLKPIVKEMAADGMLQRATLTLPGEKRARQHADGARANQDAFDRQIEDLLDRGPAQVTMKPTADRAFRERESVIYQLRDEYRNFPEFAEWIAKGPGQVARLALMLAIIDNRMNIDVCHIEKASVIWRYMLRSTQTVFANMYGQSEHLEGIGAAILALGWNRFTATDIKKHYWPARNHKVPVVQHWIRDMELTGWVLPEDPLHPRAWLVNPEVHERFRDVATREADRRARKHKLMQDLGNE